jgi:small subunit ribosomal protein S17
MAEARYGRRKTRVGVVVSDKMENTVVVAVQTSKRHRLYKKMMRRDRRFKAHDEENACQVGDKVRIVETRPLSRDKRWRVVEVLVAAAIPEAEKVVIEEETPEEIRALDEAAAAATAARVEAAAAEAAAKAAAKAAEAEATAEATAATAEEIPEPTEVPSAEEAEAAPEPEAAPEEEEAQAAEGDAEPPSAEEPETVPDEAESATAEAEGEPPEAEEQESPPEESGQEEEKTQQS